MIRPLTVGECQLIADALADKAFRLQEDADAVLNGASRNDWGDLEDKAGFSYPEKLGNEIVARSRALQKVAREAGNLADFIANPNHSVFVDCIVLIPEQA